MTGQTPGTPTNQATNNLQQLIFERQSHCIHQEKLQLPRNIRSFEDSLSSRSWHFCYIFSQKEVLVPVKSLRRGGLLIINLTFHHQHSQICLVLLCDYFIDILNTTHHTTPHHTTPQAPGSVCVRNKQTQEKWEQVVTVSDHRTNHILILFLMDFGISIPPWCSVKRTVSPLTADWWDHFLIPSRLAGLPSWPPAPSG